MEEWQRSLEIRIETAYRESPYRLGWRFLYSPAKVLNGAKVALIGLNPGGRYDDPEHGQFAMRAGSAYEVERWKGRAPGQEPLQRQVTSLFRRLNVTPKQVLAGDLVPFRSPDWRSLPDKEFAVGLGFGLWREVLDRVRPSVVVSMGKDANELIQRLVDVRQVESFPVNWGSMKAHVGSYAYGAWLGLPHLSQYKIMNRPESREPLDRALEALEARARIVRDA